MFDVSKVTSVYSGRKGCACGCRGKYSYASAHKDKRPDYYRDDNGVSDRSVRVLTQRVQDLLADRNAPVTRMWWTPDYVAVDLQHDRTYTLYFA